MVINPEEEGGEILRRSLTRGETAGLRFLKYKAKD